MIITEKHYHLEKLIYIWISYSEDILPAVQKRVVEQATFIYSLLGKVFEK